ncbi:MAG: TfoX/Sxy family protein [Candidatus Dactylopiibacterium sp.]|nr:TfoX/Sxy family protein [Candidatus Dactylopiibacterium sp.]
MSTRAEFAEYVVEQAGLGERLATRRMFGEYALYCDGKVVGLICDDQLFVKMTPAGRAHAPELPTGAPFPGAKPWLLVETELDERSWLAHLIELTAQALPPPAPPRLRRRR